MKFKINQKIIVSQLLSVALLVILVVTPSKVSNIILVAVIEQIDSH